MTLQNIQQAWGEQPHHRTQRAHQQRNWLGDPRRDATMTEGTWTEVATSSWEMPRYSWQQQGMHTTAHTQRHQKVAIMETAAKDEPLIGVPTRRQTSHKPTLQSQVSIASPAPASMITRDCACDAEGVAGEPTSETRASHVLAASEAAIPTQSSGSQGRDRSCKGRRTPGPVELLMLSLEKLEGDCIQKAFCM